MNLFWRDQAKWYKRYILGEQDEATDAMKLGKIIHKALEVPGFNWILEMRNMGASAKQRLAARKILTQMNFPPESKPEQPLIATDGDIKMFGIIDRYWPETRVMWEFKTTDRSSTWTQYRVDTNEQLSFYAYMLWQSRREYFSSMHLAVLNTKIGSTRVYTTVRSRADIVMIKEKVQKTVEKMKLLGLWNRRVSHKDTMMAKLYPQKLL